MNVSGQDNFGQIVGTWIPTWAGFSVDPSNITAEYILIGKLCMVHLRCATNGTSNATTTTVTLPFAAANTTIAYGFATIVNNGTVAAGTIATRANSAIADGYATAALGAWTSSGAKAINLSFSYIIA